MHIQFIIHKYLSLLLVTEKKSIERDFTMCCHFADCILYMIQVHPPLSVCVRLIFSFVQSLREGAVRFVGVRGQGSI